MGFSKDYLFCEVKQAMKRLSKLGISVSNIKCVCWYATWENNLTITVKSY